MAAKTRASKGLVSVKVTEEGIDEATNAILSLASRKSRRRAMKLATFAAADALRDYHMRKGAALWENRSLPTHGPGRKKTQWWRQVATGWNTGRVTYRTGQIDNSTIGLSHKVTGGTIRAKRVRFLTIPIIPRAHGLSARVYARTFAPLFAIKGVLAEKDGDGIKPVFVLKRQIKQRPWKGALPKEAEYVGPFEETLLDELEKDFMSDP
jgi:hypothetical protein